MDIKTLESFKLADAVKFHDTLNPRIWKNEKLRPEVKDQLLLIANDFVTELGIKDLDVEDITISGSNAAYTYTKHSDLDLHILVDFSKLPDDEIYAELFNAKKSQYNDSHDITIHGVPIELYVQDTNEPVISLGEYSLLKNEWIKFPKKRRANLDQAATRKKYEKLVDVIKTALKYKDEEKVDNIIQTIRRYRQAGLDKGGEFSPENLAFKMLRSQGYIDKLYKVRGNLHSKGLSIESQHEETLAEKYKREFIMTDEDYDPNGPPPGPEFKPTMPAGTVRVDVSDVYDWYKLGQHISNMKGLGKHDFGKGPPSTILSFGDEDTEHKYIKDLEKTGLKTTDIDPVDPKQPKGMKRQKVDPTYNVNEAEGVRLGPQLFVPRTKVLEGLKPDAELWTSTAQKMPDGYTSQWVEWCKDNMPGWVTDEGILYDVAPGAKILVINTDRDAIKIARKYGIDIKNPMELFMKMRWSDIAKDFDAIHHNPKDRFANAFMGTWDVESTAWFNKKYLTNPRKVKVSGAELLEVVNTPQDYELRKKYMKKQDVSEDPEQKMSVTDMLAYLKKVMGTESHEDWRNDVINNNDYFVLKDVTVNSLWSDLPMLDKAMVEKYKQMDFSKAPRIVIGSDGNIIDGYHRVNVAKALNIPVVKAWVGVKKIIESASGYIPSDAEKDDPRFKTALTVDIKPDTMMKNAKKLGSKVSRAGIPPIARPDGKF